MVEKEKKDEVNHPKHYTQDQIECIDAIKSATSEGYQYYLQGVILKYIWRYRYKHEDGLQDLKKAQWYLKKLIKEYQR